MTVEPTSEALELVRATRGYLEQLRDTGIDDVSVTDVATLTRALEGRLQSKRPKARPAQERRPQPAPRPETQPARTQPVRAQAPPAQAPAAPPAQPPIDPAERKQRLQLIANRVAECRACVLCQERTQTVFARGFEGAELAFVGEGPGFEEDRQGLPFVGPAGQLLDKMIAAMGFRPDQVYIANVVKCRPPKNRKPTEDEMAACVGYLREQLTLVNPRVIVALGATGVQGLTGTRMGITRMRGTWKLYDGRIPLMPTFHPAYLLRQPEKKRDVWNDLKAVMKELGKPIPKKR